MSTFNAEIGQHEYKLSSSTYFQLLAGNCQGKQITKPKRISNNNSIMFSMKLLISSANNNKNHPYYLYVAEFDVHKYSEHPT